MERSESPSPTSDEEKHITETEETDSILKDSAMAGNDDDENNNNSTSEKMEDDDATESNVLEEDSIEGQVFDDDDDDDDEDEDIMEQEEEVVVNKEEDDVVSVVGKQDEIEQEILEKDNNEMVDDVEIARRQSEEMNQEELFSQLESTYVSLKSEHDSLKTVYESQSNQTQESEATVLKLRKELAEKAQVIGKNELEKDEVRLTTERNQRLEVEGDALREEISRLTEANTTLQKNVSEIQADANLSSSSILPIKLELDRVKKENASITTHSTWLENELEQRNETITSLKSSHSQQILRLQNQNDAIHAEKDTLQSRFISLQRDAECIQEQANTLQREKLELQRQHADAQYTKEEELSAEKQMATLLQQKIDELNYHYEAKSNECNSIRLLIDKTTEDRDSLQNQLSEEREALLQTITECDATLADVSHQLRVKQDENEKLTNDLNLLVSTPPQNTVEEETSMIIQPEDRSLLPLTMTNLLDRLSDTETRLRTSKSSNCRLELLLQRVQLDIEQKAPKLKQQRKEYEIALEGQQRANEQLMESLRELKAVKEDGEYFKLESNECKQNLEVSMQESKDLAVQVQSLLHRQSDEDDLIDIKSIGDLQHKNQRLVKEYRALSTKLEELQTQLENDAVHSSLESANEELNALKKEQKHQESIVAGIVQQRDLYRALLSQKDGDALKEIEQSVNEVGKVDEETSKALVSLRVELSTVQNECQSLTDRNARFDTLQSELSVSITKYQQDLTVANFNIAKTQAETSFYKQRFERLEQSHENVKRELEFSSQKNKEIQNINSQMEQVVSDSKTDVLRHEQDLRQVQSKLRLLETQLQVSKVSESRLKLEFEKLQSDGAQQVSLQQSLQKIELSLSSKSDAESQAMKEDVKRLTSVLTTERAKHSTTIESMMDRISDYELQVMNLQKVQHDSSETFLKQKEEVKDLELSANTFEKKCIELEQELLDTKASLATITSGEEVIAKAQYDTLQADFEGTNSELVAAQQRLKDYQIVATNAEDALAELRNVSNEYKDRTTNELQELRSSYETSKKSSEEKGQLIQELTNDLFKQQKEQTNGESSYKDQISTLSSEVERKAKEIQEMYIHVENVTKDSSKMQQENKSAQQNYERELGLHASARTELRVIKAEIDVEELRRTKVEKELKEAQLGMENDKKIYEEKEKELDRGMEEMEQRLEESRKQNSLLHNQLSSLTDTLDKAQKVDADDAMEATTSTTEDNEEISNLRKSVTEYRGIVNYMRSERELMEGQIDSLQMKLKTQQAAGTIAKATLDESKAELQTLQKQLSYMNESKQVASSTTSEDVIKQSTIYKQASEQLVLLRESNIVLRELSERVTKKLEASVAEITELKKSLEPLEKDLSNFEVEKASWGKERESLQRENEVWKVRVQSFISKLNQVDLEEYEKVVREVESLKKEVDAVKTNKDRIEQESTGAKSLVTRLNSQITELKRALDKMKGDDDKSKLLKEREGSLTSIKKLTQENASAKIELAATKGRVENLTKMLRKYKKLMDDLRRKEAENSSKEAEMQKVLDGEREMCKKLKNDLEVLIGAAKNPKSTKVDDSSKKSTATLVSTPIVSISSKKSTATPVSTPIVSIKTPLPAAATTEKELSTTATTESSSSATPTIEVPLGGFKFSASIKPEKKESDNVLDPTEDHADEGKDPAEASGASVDKSEPTTGVETSNVESSKSMEEESEPQPQDTISIEESMRKKLLLKRKKELEVALLNKKEEDEDIKDMPVDNTTGDGARKRIKLEEERKEADQDATTVDGTEGGNSA